MPLNRQKLASRVSSVGAGVLLAAIAVVAASLPWSLERELWAIRATGYAALGALFLALSMTPANRLLDRLAPGRVATATLIAWRRSFGVTAAWLALVHAGVALSTYLQGSWPAVLHRAHLRAGLAALAILSALLVTSYPKLVARLRLRLWKPLHPLGYVAVVLVFQHLILSPFAPRMRTLVLFGGLLAVGALRLLPSRPRRPTVP